MYFLLEVCQHPGVLRVIYFAKIIEEIIFIVVPIGLIVMTMVDFSKAVVSGDPGEQSKKAAIIPKRLLYAFIVFVVPWIVKVVMSVLDQAGVDIGTDYETCLANAKPENFDYYDSLLADEEKIEAEELARKREKERSKNKYDKETDKFSLIRDDKPSGGESSSGESSTSGAGNVISGEPTDPLLPLKKLYDATGYEIYNPNNYEARKDSSGMSLGAWPKGASTANLSGNLKTYQNDRLIYPITGTGYGSYNHNGIDIVTNNTIGRPIYAPADGMLMYSEWGHTQNKAPNETAYSAKIVLDNSFSFTGEWASGISTNGFKGTYTVTRIYMTHMMGIARRVSSGSSVKIKKGELIGFSGVANSTPHLHMTFYTSDEKAGVYTTGIRQIYGINSSVEREAGK